MQTAGQMNDGQPGTSWTYVYDPIGNRTSSVKAHYEYDPYGSVIAESGTYAAANRWRFSTKQFDAESGWGYWGVRYYDPVHGRWTNHDPIEELGGLNVYVSVANDPLTRTDSLGLTDRRKVVHLPDGDEIQINCAIPDPEKPGGPKPPPCRPSDIKACTTSDNKCAANLETAKKTKDIKDLAKSIGETEKCKGTDPLAAISCGQCTAGCKGAGAWHFGSGQIVICDDQNATPDTMRDYLAHELTHELQRCNDAPDRTCEERLMREMEAYLTGTGATCRTALQGAVWSSCYVSKCDLDDLNDELVARLMKWCVQRRGGRK